MSLTSDWSTVLKKWDLSFPSRNKEIQLLKLHDIYKLYPCLGRGVGYQLVCLIRVMSFSSEPLPLVVSCIFELHTLGRF